MHKVGNVSRWDLGLKPATDEDVAGLQISVDDRGLVRVQEGHPHHHPPKQRQQRLALHRHCLVAQEVPETAGRGVVSLQRTTDLRSPSSLSHSLPDR